MLSPAKSSTSHSRVSLNQKIFSIRSLSQSEVFLNQDFLDFLLDNRVERSYNGFTLHYLTVPSTRQTPDLPYHYRLLITIDKFIRSLM